MSGGLTNDRQTDRQSWSYSCSRSFDLHGGINNIGFGVQEVRALIASDFDVELTKNIRRQQYVDELPYGLITVLSFIDAETCQVDLRYESSRQSASSHTGCRRKSLRTSDEVDAASFVSISKCQAH